MANVDWTVQQLNGGAGAALATSYNGSLSISDTYYFQNDGRTFLHAKKTGAGACTVTADTPANARGVAIANPTYTVPATTGDVLIGPFAPDLFNDSNNKCAVTLSEITGLSVGVFRLP